MNFHRASMLCSRFPSTAAIVCCNLAISSALAHQISPRIGGDFNDARQLAAPVEGAELTLLRNAYVHLAVGNHNYDGHRGDAMKAVAAAGDALGTDIRGDGDSKQPQRNSDDDLKTAQTLIQRAQQMAMDAGQPKVVAHLKKAIAEIRAALAVK